MPLHHALLSLLDRDESYGYELKTAFESSVGAQWGPLNIGHVYQLLRRLERDGLVAVVRAEPHGGRPDRVIYAITDDGRRELRDWLEQPSGAPAGYRDDLHLKLTAAARDGEPTLHAVIRRERTALLGELHALRSLPPEPSPSAALLVESAALQAEARLKVLDAAEASAGALVDSAARDRPSTGHAAARRAG
jgi:DNA-binding PadR family transcriptional regulator